MNIQEYELVKEMSYGEYCNYLDKKYSNSDKIGLFKHHTFENVKPNLSNPEFAKDATEEEKNTITYCSFDEHLFLHILIGEQTDARKALGIGGAVNYIIPQLNKYFNNDVMDYSEVYYNNLDKSVFDILANRCNEDLSKINIALDHNQTVYLQAENYLNTKNKALVIIGTGLGKTTTALEYLWKNKCRALVIGPNNLIKNGWEEYSDWCDVTTYQAFANSYYNIDYSKYGVVILDEAHHIGYNEETEKGAKVWSEGIRYLFNNNIKVLGLTATPERSDKIDISKTFFKDCVCEGFAVEDGIENGIIHPFSYITAYYDTNGILDQYSDCENKELVGQLDLAINNTPTIKEIFKKHMPDNRRKGIVFIQEIDDEAEVISIMKDVYPNVEMRMIHSKMNQGEIEDNRNWFENTDKGYLLAVNMISEGAHYKGVNTLIMFRRTNSYLVFTQQLGRIITLTKNENPNAVVFDLVNNIENVQYGNNNTELKNKHSISKIIKVLKKSEAFKSNQIIISDETRDIVKCIRDIKSFENIYWTEEEIKLLKQYYPIEGPCICNRIKRKSRQCCQLKANNLGLRYDAYWWTDEDLQILKQYYPIEGRKVSNRLSVKRSNQTIKATAKKYGIKGPIKKILTSDEEDILKKYYPIEGTDVVKRFENLTIPQLQGIAHRLGLKYMNHWWSKDEIEIIKEYYPTEGTMCYKRLQNRTQEQVGDIARKYNIRYITSQWSNEEDEILKQYYPFEGSKVYKRLNRTSKACIRRAKMLNIRYDNIYYDNIYTESEIEIIKKYYPTEGASVFKRLNKHTKKSVVRKARELGVKVTTFKKKVICIETNIIFDSIASAAKYANISYTSISSVINGKTKTAGGYHWKYVEEENKNN